jgi:hypothetical protein
MANISGWCYGAGLMLRNCGWVVAASIDMIASFSLS